MLFCVTTRGRERIFNKPRDSAMVRMASSRALLLAVRKLKPLVGPVTPRLENNGIFTPVPAVGALVPMIGYSAPGVPNALVGELPTALAPPKADPALPNPKPNCVPMSRAKLRV